MGKFQDLKSRKINEWTVLERAPNRFGHRAYWKCQCSCGHISEIASQTLLNETSKRCLTCIRKIHIRRIIKLGTTHGFCRNNKKPLEYHIWNSIKNRCYNKNMKGYPNYGGRGITMSEDWKNSFISFFNDMGPKPFKDASIERKDTDGIYSKENCIWLKRSLQGKNTRRNPIVNGIRICITDESRKMDKCRFFVGQKIKEGFSLEEISNMKSNPYKEYYFPEK